MIGCGVWEDFSDFTTMRRLCQNGQKMGLASKRSRGSFTVGVRGPFPFLLRSSLLKARSVEWRGLARASTPCQPTEMQRLRPPPDLPFNKIPRALEATGPHYTFRF